MKSTCTNSYTRQIVLKAEWEPKLIPMSGSLFLHHSPSRVTMLDTLVHSFLSKPFSCVFCQFSVKIGKKGARLIIH